MYNIFFSSKSRDHSRKHDPVERSFDNGWSPLKEVSTKNFPSSLAMFRRECSLVKFLLPVVITSMDTWLSLASCTWALVALSLQELSSPINRTAIFFTPSLPPREKTVLMALMHWSVRLGVLSEEGFSSFLTFSSTSNVEDRNPLVLTLPLPQTTKPI